MRVLPIVAALPLYTLFFLLVTSSTHISTCVDAFVPLSTSATRNAQDIRSQSSLLQPTTATTTTTKLAFAKEDDAAELVGRRIIVTGDVNGGYIRTCIMNEAAVFRKLIGTMTPPDSSSSTAEIYVEVGCITMYSTPIFSFEHEGLQLKN